MLYVGHRNSVKLLDKSFKNKTDLSNKLHWNGNSLEFIVIIALGSSLNYLFPEHFWAWWNALWVLGNLKCTFKLNVKFKFNKSKEEVYLEAYYKSSLETLTKYSDRGTYKSQQHWRVFVCQDRPLADQTKQRKYLLRWTNLLTSSSWLFPICRV